MSWTHRACIGLMAALGCQSGGPAGPPPGTRVGYYAAPGGTDAGDGSTSRPWDLATALAGGNGGVQVQPGDTIWVRGGAYPGTFRSTLTGTSAAPIVVRRYPGERPILAGDGSSNTLKIDGAWTYFWGLEVQVSTSDRTTPRMDAVYVRYTANVKLINLVVHDGGTGIYTEPGAPGVEIYGCIVYNNGWQAGAGDRGHGHAIYVKNDAGTKLVREVSDPAVIAVFRVAIAEAVQAPEVAHTLDSTGREKSRAALRKIMALAQASGLLAGRPAKLAEQFVGLLWGHLMVSLLLGVAKRPNPREIARRAGDAAAAFLQLHPLPKEAPAA